MSFDTTFTPVVKCLRCGHKIDAATDVGHGAVPTEGDVSVCLHCGALAIFSKDLTLREPTPEERLEASLHPDVIKAQLYIASRK